MNKNKFHKGTKINSNRYKIFVDNSKDAFYVTDITGKILDVNKTACNSLGFTRKELLNLSISDINVNFPGEKYSEFLKSLKIDKPKIIVSTHKRKNGELFSVESLVNAFVSNEDLLFVSITSNISSGFNRFELSENKYKNIIEKYSEMIWILDKKGKFTFVNKKVEELSGFKFEYFIGKSFAHFLSQEDFSIVKDVIIKTLEGSSVDFEFHLRVPPKKVLLLESHSNPIYEDGKIVGIIALGKDITEKKEKVKLLKKSRDKYYDFFEKSKDPILIISNEKFIDCNQATIDLLLYKDKSQLFKKHPSQLSPLKQPDGRNSIEKANEYMQIAFETGSCRFEWEHIKANGEIFPVEVLLTAISLDGESKILHTSWRDISKQKNSEKLQNALYSISEEVNKPNSIEELYAALHNIIGTLMPAKNFFIAIHNLETNLIKFPYYFDEHDPSPIERPFGDGLTERILKSKKSQIINGEKKIKQLGIIKEEKFFPKQWVGIYLNFESKYKGVLALQDYNSEKVYNKEHLKLLQFVSEHIVKVLDKRYANELIQKSVLELSEAKKELELINKNKNRFFSIIAHDLRSPFMTLLGISQMVSEEFENLSIEEIKELTNTFYNSTQNIYKLIENLLTWSRLQLNTFKINPNKLDLKTVVHNVKQVVEFVAKNKNISIQDYIPQTFVWADKNCVETVLRNLIGNAIKYSNRGGEIKLSVIENKDFVEISIIDNGIGMNKPTLNSLFNIGNVVSKKGTENEQGSALGLILCKDLLTKNNGKIWAESKLGKGSKFIFTLPLVQ